jgi:lipopolysaccharide biosynthesis protein
MPEDSLESALLPRPESPALAALTGFASGGGASVAAQADDACRLIAFYLPQFHAIPENDEWWGPGFTEWTNVARGRPNFDGHDQPHIPRELGFYDLTNPAVMRAQAEMARLYGIDGFCFYHYWFSGRRVLERPLDAFLASDIDLKFCICWANENWTRTWDGDERTVLLEQRYEQGDDERFFRSIERVILDRRYIRVRGKPLLAIYRAKHIPDPRATIATWRRLAAELGLPGLHVAAVDFYDISDPREVGADSLIEFPPHKFNGPSNMPSPCPRITNPAFQGGILDYRKMVAQAVHRRTDRFPYFRGIMPGWDNTARRQDTPTTVIHSSPDWYRKWLRYLRAWTREHAAHPDEAIIFVNAWNEWGEGCHLEPDLRWGLGFLEETLRSRAHDPSEALDAHAARLHRELAAALASDARPGDAPGPLPAGPYYRPVSERVRRISHALRRHPLLHRAGRALYRACTGNGP